MAFKCGVHKLHTLKSTCSQGKNRLFRTWAASRLILHPLPSYAYPTCRMHDTLVCCSHNMFCGCRYIYSMYWSIITFATVVRKPILNLLYGPRIFEFDRVHGLLCCFEAMAPNVFIHCPTMMSNSSTVSTKPFTVQICLRFKRSYETWCALRHDGRSSKTVLKTCRACRDMATYTPTAFLKPCSPFSMCSST
jgi:hypothetical protein